MFYRPNFCCNCGEKIERVEWSIFSSRKFCDLCQSELRARDLGPKLLAVVVLVFTSALASSVFRPSPPASKVVTSALISSSLAESPRTERSLNTTSNAPTQSQTGTNVNTSTVTLPSADFPKPVTTAKSTEAVYFCGAATKKGTPCSRRVKRPGERCWQHQGMPSILDENGTARK